MRILKNRKVKNALLMENKKEVRNALFLQIALIAASMAITGLIVFDFLHWANILFFIPIAHYMRINAHSLMIKRSVLNFKRYHLDPDFKKKYDKENNITHN
tara:strand:+ start:850 stop:1152 length:303 start_codon:yes stop_codon:yes gene_type:complete